MVGGEERLQDTKPNDHIQGECSFKDVAEWLRYSQPLVDKERMTVHNAFFDRGFKEAAS